MLTASIAGFAGIIGTLAVAHLIGDDSTPATSPAADTRPLPPSGQTDRSGQVQAPGSTGKGWSATPGQDSGSPSFADDDGALTGRGAAPGSRSSGSTPMPSQGRSGAS